MMKQTVARFGFVLILSLAGAIPAWAQETDVVLLTLEEALNLARQHAPSLQVADRQIDRAQAQEREAWLAYLPTLSARSTWTLSGPIRGTPCEGLTGTDIDMLEDLAEEVGFQTNNSLRAVLPLYTFGKIGLAQDLAAVGFEVAMLQSQKAELELNFEVQRAYLGLQLSEKYNDLIDDGLSRLRSIRENLEERLLEGDRSARTDLRQLTIREADLAGQVADNRQLNRLARRALRYYCGIEGPFRVTPFDESIPENELAPPEALMDLAWEHRPDLTLLDRAIVARNLVADMAWRRMTPDFFFSLGFSLNYNPLADDQSSPFAYDPYNSSGLGFLVGLDWDFDFRWIAQAQQAELDADIARVQQRQAVGGVELEIEQAYYEALGFDDRLDAYDNAYRASRAWLRQSTLQFDSGLADYEDLRDPLINYFSTSANYYQALFDSQLARANLALKVGLERLSTGQGLIEAEDQPAAEPLDEDDTGEP